MPEIKPAVLESLLGLVVHDLRNPAATIGANLSFVSEALHDPSVERAEIGEALADAQQGLYELMRGLDQLFWIGRWCNERPPGGTKVEPLRATFERVSARVKYGALEVEPPDPGLRAAGGDLLERLLELLIVNGHQHAPRAAVKLRALSATDSGRALIEVEDRGRPLSPQLQPLAFTIEGQTSLKGVPEGRYSRVAGLFVANVLAQALGGTLEAIERDGANVFRVTLPRA